MLSFATSDADPVDPKGTSRDECMCHDRRAVGASMPAKTITIDYRERGSGVPEKLSEIDGMQIVWASLKTGDYVVDRLLAVERKTAEDLARSIIDGRLFRQVSEMRRRYPRALVLLEGWQSGVDVLGVSAAALQGALISVAAVFGVPIIYTTGAADSARSMAWMAEQVRQSRQIGRIRWGYRPKGWHKRALFILQGLPHVGPRRAQALLDEFGSVEAVVRARREDLMRVTGIGQSMAGAMRVALGSDPRRRQDRSSTP
jgi:DNA excision repair protein ERCC-4